MMSNEDPASNPKDIGSMAAALQCQIWVQFDSHTNFCTALHAFCGRAMQKARFMYLNFADSFLCVLVSCCVYELALKCRIVLHGDDDDEDEDDDDCHDNGRSLSPSFCCASVTVIVLPLCRQDQTSERCM